MLLNHYCCICSTHDHCLIKNETTRWSCIDLLSKAGCLKDCMTTILILVFTLTKLSTRNIFLCFNLSFIFPILLQYVFFGSVPWQSMFRKNWISQTSLNGLLLTKKANKVKLNCFNYVFSTRLSMSDSRDSGITNSNGFVDRKFWHTRRDCVCPWIC